MAKTTSKTRRTKNEEDFEMEPLQQQPILSSIKVNLKCKTEKQKTLCKLIESKDVTIAAGPAGCLTKNEKIKVYMLRNKP